jgi:hypothetical protein
MYGANESVSSATRVLDGTSKVARSTLQHSTSLF